MNQLTMFEIEPVEIPPIPQEAKAKLVRVGAKSNPAVEVWGAGPVGVTCATCLYLTRMRNNSWTGYKCQKRGISHGAGTDHRLKWQACSKYEKESE
jgi:hypothetical protein